MLPLLEAVPTLDIRTPPRQKRVASEQPGPTPVKRRDQDPVLSACTSTEPILSSES